MPSDAIRKRCVECNATAKGTKGKAQWCPRCGGEMIDAPYRSNRKRRRA